MPLPRVPRCASRYFPTNQTAYYKKMAKMPFAKLLVLPTVVVDVTDFQHIRRLCLVFIANPDQEEGEEEGVVLAHSTAQHIAQHIAHNDTACNT